MTLLFILYCTSRFVELPPGRDVEMTMAEALSILRSNTQPELCLIGTTTSQNRFGLLKKPPGQLEKGRFMAMITSRTGFFNEFYDDPESAMKALTDRGVVKIRTCP